MRSPVTEPLNLSISSAIRGSKSLSSPRARTARAVLKAAKLDHCFDVQVDCDVIHAEHLASKPAPDTYLMAAKSVVIEDALAGMEAGSNGNFGFVIGVARKRNAVELRHHGAHLVVNDLNELVS